MVCDQKLSNLALGRACDHQPRSAVMTEETLPDLYLFGHAHLTTEAIEELHGWPDLHQDVLAALLELPDRLMDLTKAWPW